MKRRSLLKAAGLAAVVDVEGVTADAGSRSDDGRGEQTDAARTAPNGFFARLSPLADVDGGLLAAHARGRVLEERPDAAILGEAHAVGSVVGPDVAMRVGYGGMTRRRIVEHVRSEGFEEAEVIAGQQAFARGSRGRVRVVVPGAVATTVGRGPAYGPVASMAEQVLTPAGTPTSALATAVDLLGDGVTAAVEVTDEPPCDRNRSEPVADDGGDPRPVVSGERVDVVDGDASLRRVAVYPSRAASLAARDSDWGPWPGGVSPARTEVTRRGRAVVRDARVSDPETLLAPGK